MNWDRNGDFNWSDQYVLPWEVQDYIDVMTEVAIEEYDFGAINEQVMWVGDQCPFYEQVTDPEYLPW